MRIKKYYSVSSYANKMGITAQTVYNRIRDNKLDFIEVSIGKANKKSYIITVSEEEDV